MKITEIELRMYGAVMDYVKKSSFMNKVLLTAFLIIINQFAIGQKRLEIGMPAPQIKFISSFPSKYQIPKDKPILIDFWATWCGPCIAGLLKTNDLIDEYSDRIEFLAMTDPTSRKVDQFVHSKKFMYHFLIDSTGQTFNDYLVKSIPQVVLIDRSGIIQWVGNGNKVSRKLLDEFLLNNTIVKNTNSYESHNNSKNQAARDSVINHDIKFIINEKEILDPEFSYSTNFKSDSFKFNSFYQSIKLTIYNLNNNQENRTIFRNCDNSIIGKRISITYETTNVDVEKEKLKLINFIGNQYGFKAGIEYIDTTVWVLSVIKNNLLQKNLSISIGKSEELTGGIYKDHDKEGNSITMINASVKLLCEYLENEFGFFCKTTYEDNAGYDFFNVDCSDQSKLFEALEKVYGIKATREDVNLPFLVVSPD